jgi:hypothetical protein
VNVGGKWVCRPTAVLVTVPAVDAVPATPGTPGTQAELIADYRLGWNAGGTSIPVLGGDGYYEFKVWPGAVGVVAGLADRNESFDYREVTHGFYCSQGIARVIESGHQLSGGYFYNDTTVFRVQRNGSVVSYWINDVLQALSQQPSYGVIWLDVSLFNGDDYLFDPEVQALEGAGGTPPGNIAMPSNPESVIALLGALRFPVMGVSGGNVPFAQSAMRMEVMHVFNGGEGSADLTFLPLSAAGGEGDYAGLTVSFMPMGLDGGDSVPDPGDLIPSIALGWASAVQMTTTGMMLTGEIADGDMSSQPLQMLAAEAEGYGAGSVRFEPMFTLGEIGLPSLDVEMREQLLAGGLFDDLTSIEATLITGMNGLDVYVQILLSTATLLTDVEADGTFTITSQMNAVILTDMSAHAGLPLLDETGEVWVVNTESSASTTYEGFGFNSFGKLRGKYYGARADGLYLLGGDTDNGEPIQASMAFGKKDFGTTAQKAISAAYLGLASTGTIWLKVIVDGKEYLYRTTRADAELTTQRIKTGRGLKANYLSFELYNDDGADFELESVEFELAQLSRRI